MDPKISVPDNENEKRFNVTLKVDDEKMDDVVPPLPEPSKSESIAGTTVRKRYGCSSSNNEQAETSKSLSVSISLRI